VYKTVYINLGEKNALNGIRFTYKWTVSACHDNLRCYRCYRHIRYRHGIL